MMLSNRLTPQLAQTLWHISLENDSRRTRRREGAPLDFFVLLRILHGAIYHDFQTYRGRKASMTHMMLLQTVLALTAATMSIGVAIGGFAMAPRRLTHRTLAIAMACLALMQLGAGLSPQSMFWERLRLLASAGLPGLGLLFSVCFARLNPREHVRAWRWAIAIALALPLGLVIAQPVSLALNWAGHGFYILARLS
jgi:hypothetical protein